MASGRAITHSVHAITKNNLLKDRRTLYTGRSRPIAPKERSGNRRCHYHARGTPDRPSKFLYMPELLAELLKKLYSKSPGETDILGNLCDKILLNHRCSDLPDLTKSVAQENRDYGLLDGV